MQSNTQWSHIMMKFIIILGTILFKYAMSEGIEAVADDVQILTNPLGSFKPKAPTLPSGEFKWEIKPNTSEGHFKSIDLFLEVLYIHENDRVTIFKNLNDSSNDSLSIIEPIQAQNGSITIMTDEPTVVVKLSGTNRTFTRNFKGSYTSQNCAFTVLPVPHIIHSPIYIGKNDSVECHYVYNHDFHFHLLPVFLFKKYNFTTSGVSLEHTTSDGKYNNEPLSEFFFNQAYNSMTISVDIKDREESFLLQMDMVDSRCSAYLEPSTTNMVVIESPSYTLDYDALENECRWIIKHKSSEILGINFAKLEFDSVLDIVSVNDGPSAIAPPLLQVTKSNANQTAGQIIRSSGPYLWISFKPVTYNSKMMANITIHSQGGHFKGNGKIAMKSPGGSDTVFLLEVDENEVVLLNFTSSSFKSPATLNIYDGFNKKTLITQVHGSIWYPILSKTNKMLVAAEGFDQGSFEATFIGKAPGCSKMSSSTSGNYVLSGNCNDTCMWIIPPQDLSASSILLDLQYISLEKEDHIEIHQLDAAKSLIGAINATMSYVPQMIIPSTIGVLVEVSRKQCVKEDNIALIGHSSFTPDFGGEVVVKPGEAFHITSPLYPDTYPVFADCSWTFSSPKKSIIHLTFQKFSLADNHCLKIFDAEKNVTSEVQGSLLPEDIFLSNGSALHFISSKCKASQTTVQLTNDGGFMLNGTVAECGALLEKKASGDFNVNVTSGNQSLCLWNVNVPASSDDSVNIIAYTVSVKEDKGNYELHVFDGASVRDSQIVNISTTEMWSRTNNLIFIYKRLNTSLPSSAFLIKYRTISCNISMQCDNKICMHPDWKCNGKNDCGDFTDEKNCNSILPPPPLKPSGYSPSAFWITVLSMLAVGLLLGFGVPFFYQKYKNGQYHRFGDISVIE